MTVLVRFFGIVMFLLFWVGSFWREDELPCASRAGPVSVGAGGASAASTYVTWLLLLVATSVGPAIAWGVSLEQKHGGIGPLSAFAPEDGWDVATDADWWWQPSHLGADRELQAVYRRDELVVAFFVRQHLQQEEGVELVQNRAPWRHEDSGWRVLSDSTRSVAPPTVPAFNVREARVESPSGQVLVWSWYRVAGRYTDNPYRAKLLEAQQLLRHGQREGSRLFLAMPAGEDLVQSRREMWRFLDAHLPALEQTLDQRLPEPAR